MEFIFLLGLSGCCIPTMPTKDSPDRVQISRSLMKILPGSSSVEVIGRVGIPDAIIKAGSYQVFGYGKQVESYIFSRGQVFFKADDRVVFVMGNSDTAPGIDIIDDRELFQAIMVIHNASRMFSADSCFNPAELASSCNLLLPFGKRKILAAFREYLRIGPDHYHYNLSIFLLLRLLFEIPGGTHHPLAIGELRPSKPPMPLLCPSYPLLIVDDIPFLVITSYFINGIPERPSRHLPYYARFGVLHDRPLRIPDDPVAVFEKLALQENLPYYEYITDKEKQRVLSVLFSQAQVMAQKKR